MRIGIDIDNVISNFNDVLLKEYLKHDKVLRNTGIVDENADYIRKGMFDWTKDEEEEFYFSNIERIAKSLEPIHHAIEIMQKLKEDGHELYIVSGRANREYTNPKEMTIEWLEKYNVPYDKLILTDAYVSHEKAEACIENKIDIMIDDSRVVCMDLKQSGVNTLMMTTRYNQKEDFPNRVKNWKEIYAKISASYPKEEVQKLNVILDTDIYNECDDQFALSYLLKSQDRFNIEAITVAPYHHDNCISIEEGTEKSYHEILKICKWLDFNSDNKVFKGATDYLKNDNGEENDAVEKIIEVAKKNDKTYIMAIGAITNVAMAIQKEPDIVPKIEVVWLGGHSLLMKDNSDFNFRQDVQAVQTVFNSNVKLTVIPCENVASNLRTSIYELHHYLKGKSELCDYLCERFYNDGVHGLQERRVIWDISVVAYLLHKEWFVTEEINRLKVNDDTTYEKTNSKEKMTMVNNLDVDKIFSDLFERLTR